MGFLLGSKPVAHLMSFAGLRIDPSIGPHLIANSLFPGAPVSHVDLGDLRWQLLPGHAAT